MYELECLQSSPGLWLPVYIMFVKLSMTIYGRDNNESGRTESSTMCKETNEMKGAKVGLSFILLPTPAYSIVGVRGACDVN